jgi:predicted RNase H-like HicB family nuclease
VLREREYRDMMRYKVVLKESEEGFSVLCPALPGCWSQGDAEEEALENIQDAIQEYLAAIEGILRDNHGRRV